MLSANIQRLASIVTGGGAEIVAFVPINRANSAAKAHRMLVDDDPNRGAYSGGWSTVYLLTKTHRTPMTIGQAREYADDRIARLRKGNAEAIKIIESKVVDDHKEVVKVRAANTDEAYELAVAKVKHGIRPRKNVVDTVEADSWGGAKKLRGGGRTPLTTEDWGKSGWIVRHSQRGFRSGIISGQPVVGYDGDKIMSKAEAKRAIQDHIETDRNAGSTKYLIVNVYPGSVLTPSGTAAQLPTWEVTVNVKRVKTGTKPIGWYIYGIASS